MRGENLDRLDTAAVSPALLVRQLADLGVEPGDVVMVHASLKAIGPVRGGAPEVARALQSAVGPEGGLLAYASWDRSSYDETLNGRRLSPNARADWPAFDPATANVYPGFGMLNTHLRVLPGALRSAHPDASMIAVGPMAASLVSEHRLGDPYGPTSPLHRFVALGGKVLMLGAPLDAVTVLHYAEAIAEIPGKRRVTYEAPLLGPDGAAVWTMADELDSNGVLDVYAAPEGPDAVELIARDYVAAGRPREGAFGAAVARLFEAGDLVAFGKQWLEARHGGPIELEV